MRNNYIGIFDVIGPIMVGPSSSHTSGAATIAWMARQLFNGEPTRVTFTLYGSFAETYRGHGTDRALIGGILGYRSDDVRIRTAYEEAEKAGLEVKFIPDRETETEHPNTVEIEIEGRPFAEDDEAVSDEGHTDDENQATVKKLTITGESIGGGRVRITRMNNIDVDFNGEYSTLIIEHRDEAGTIAYITKCLAEHRVNIAFMKLYREAKGKKAVAVIESDEFIPDEIVKKLLAYPTVENVEVIEF